MTNPSHNPSPPVIPFCQPLPLSIPLTYNDLTLFLLKSSSHTIELLLAQNHSLSSIETTPAVTSHKIPKKKSENKASSPSGHSTPTQTQVNLPPSNPQNWQASQTKNLSRVLAPAGNKLHKKSNHQSTQNTPRSHLSSRAWFLKIGSRSIRRKSSTRIGHPRAIPWIFT